MVVLSRHFLAQHIKSIKSAHHHQCNVLSYNDNTNKNMANIL